MKRFIVVIAAVFTALTSLATVADERAFNQQISDVADQLDAALPLWPYLQDRYIVLGRDAGVQQAYTTWQAEENKITALEAECYADYACRIWRATPDTYGFPDAILDRWDYLDRMEALKANAATAKQGYEGAFTAVIQTDELLSGYGISSFGQLERSMTFHRENFEKEKAEHYRISEQLGQLCTGEAARPIVNQCCRIGGKVPSTMTAEDNSYMESSCGFLQICRIACN